MGPSQKYIDLSRQISKKIRFTRQIDEKCRFNYRQNFRMTFYSHLFQNDRLSRQNLPFTAIFWANYSISLEKSSLSNILPVHDTGSRRLATLITFLWHCVVNQQLTKQGFIFTGIRIAMYSAQFGSVSREWSLVLIQLSSVQFKSLRIADCLHVQCRYLTSKLSFFEF